ncbi:hypothetical protein A2379_00460 [Candidatus Amesbacteria bacterium RIFOXYB1_FULL_47_13]|nr:MAG: hypothetical protein A2379_00460 [Candidatus Amesbacteria bacterium RIFOXYB1_FULL_47_13]
MHVDYAEKFIKQLKKASKTVQKSVRERVEIYISDKFHPLLNNHALSGKYQGYRSINVTGDWQAVFRMIDDDTVYFEMLGTHSRLYK